MRNKITELEYKMMTKWRDWYGWQEAPTQDCEVLPIREILEEWENSKGDLFTLLGGNLILTKEVSFEKSPNQLVDAMIEMYNRHSIKATRIDRPGWIFRDNFAHWINENYPLPHYGFFIDIPPTKEEEEEENLRCRINSGLSLLISFATLSKNVYEGADFTITLPNGKPYTVRSGCKPMKPLGKIADAFGIGGFEDFRLCHSQVLNQKTLKGELSISIHPLDYWTMSDNDLGWESCMNWRDCGGYRQGTVEMMNSPSVVVAYLNASEPMHIGSEDDMVWSNKKWRSLFIVDKDVILSIKSYPYANDNLTKTTMKWLKELAEQNLNWKYWQDEPEDYKRNNHYRNPNSTDKNDVGFTFTFHSNNMYTDVGSANHFIYIGENLYSKDIPGYVDKQIPNYLYNYSGAAQCMSCGKTDPNIDSECCLVCANCEQITYCQECGERIYPDDGYWLEGAHLCECCYDNLAGTCEQCERDLYYEDLNHVRFLFPVDEETEEFLEKEYPINKYERETLDLKHALLTSEIHLCDSCLERFVKNSIKPGAKLKEFKNEYGNWYYGVFIDDIIPEEIEEYLTPEVYDAMQRGETNLEIVKKYFHRYDHFTYHRMSDSHRYFYRT